MLNECEIVDSAADTKTHLVLHYILTTESIKGYISVYVLQVRSLG